MSQNCYVAHVCFDVRIDCAICCLHYIIIIFNKDNWQNRPLCQQQQQQRVIEVIPPPIPTATDVSKVKVVIGERGEKSMHAA